MNNVYAGITDVPFHGENMEKKFEICKFVDPRFDCNNPAFVNNRYVVVSGGPQISRYETQCDERTEDIIRWGNRRTLGSKFLYDSHWYIEYTVVITFGNLTKPGGDHITAHAAAGNTDRSLENGNLSSIFKDMHLAFKPFPLHQCTRSIQLKLNDKEINCLPRETLAARMEYWDQAKLHEGCSACPCERPNSQLPIFGRMRELDNPARSLKSSPKGLTSNACVVESMVKTNMVYGDAQNAGNLQHVAADDNDLIYPNGWNPFTDSELGDYHWDNALPAANGKAYYKLVAKIREPVLIEPLTFTNGPEFNPPMWNLDNFELTYNIDSLKNMITMDIVSLVGEKLTYDATAANKCFRELKTTHANCPQLVKDLMKSENCKVFLKGDPKLIYYVYTPIPGNEPRMPYMSPYKEFKRYRSSDYVDVPLDTNFGTHSNLSLGLHGINAVPEYELTTGRIDMVYYPHSIYIYVTDAVATMHTYQAMVTNPNSFAKITHVSCTYGNCTTIMDSFKDIDLYNMSLRNGLHDRSYVDWNLTPKSISSFDRIPLYDNGESVTLCDLSLVPGIGSVVRLVPGIDLHTGGMTGRMIGGCPAVSKSIEFRVKFKPLDYISASRRYELNVVFEQQGALVMQDGQCRVGLVGCESVEWYDMQSLTQVTCDYNIQGSEIEGGSIFGKAWRAVKKGASWAYKNKIASKLLNIFGGDDPKNEKLSKVTGIVDKIEDIAKPPPTKVGSGYKRRYYKY
jgi:hypothetical protein